MNKFSMKPDESDVASAGPCIGIDLGTTNSCVCYYDSILKNTVIVPNKLGRRTTPSVVLYETQSGQEAVSVIVGEAARRKSALNPGDCLYVFKRLMGKKFTEDDAKDVLGSSYKKGISWQSQLETHFPFKIVNKDGRMAVKLSNGVLKSPEEISADALAALKADAEKTVGSAVTQAVITVPAYFNDDQRQATKNAAAVAGLKVLRLVNEPTAAALAYGVGKSVEKQTILVFDLGGGTFDVSILDIEDGIFEVRSVHGDTHLGGEDFDQVIVEYILSQDTNIKTTKKKITFQDALDSITGKDRSTVMQRLKTLAEDAKISLSSSTHTDIVASFLMNYKHPETKELSVINLETSLSREKFVSLCEAKNLFNRCLASVDQALKNAKIDKKDAKTKISRVLAVGGMTRMPHIAKIIKDHYNIELDCSINPDEVVAEGAAVQAGILSKDIKGVVLLDVTPLSLGIETMGGVFTAIIEKNTTIPTKKSQIFSTAADRQTSVQIIVYQGDRALAKDNKLLGEFTLGDIAPAPRGVPQIEVSFDLDADGILVITAKDLTTGKEASVTITNKNISKEEIERMKRDHEENKERDENIRQQISLRNESTHLIDSTEKSLKEHDAILTDAIKTETKDAIEELNECLKSDELNIDETTTQVNKLRESSMKIGQHVYSQKKDSSTAEEDPSKPQE